MAQEKFIHQHQPFQEGGEHRHTGMRSHLRGLAESAERLKEFVVFDARRQRIAAHETGASIGNGMELYPGAEDTEMSTFFIDRKTERDCE